MDITDDEAVAAIVADVAQRHGGIDVAFNVAGVLPPIAPMINTPKSDWDLAINVNLTATWLCTKYQLQVMQAAGSGAIVNTASSLGVEMLRPGFAPYTTSKAGVRIVTQTAALEAAPFGVRVNCVSPGTVATSMSIRPGETPEDRDKRASALIPLNRIADPNEIIDAVLWWASDESSYVTGRDILVDGGQVLHR